MGGGTTLLLAVNKEKITGMNRHISSSDLFKRVTHLTFRNPFNKMKEITRNNYPISQSKTLYF